MGRFTVATMGANLPTRRLLAGLTATVLLGGCAAGASVAPAATATPPSTTFAPMGAAGTPGASATPSSAALSEAPARSEAPAASQEARPPASPGVARLTAVVTVKHGSESTTFGNGICAEGANGDIVVSAANANGVLSVLLRISPSNRDPSLPNSFVRLGYLFVDSLQATLGADKSGTFSGTDDWGESVRGTFACGGTATPGSIPSAVAAVTTPAPTTTPVAAASQAPSASPSARPSGALEPVHVTGAMGEQAGGGGFGLGSACGWGASYCSFNVDMAASDDRLSGCFILQPTGNTVAASWGTFRVYRNTKCGYGVGLPEGKVAWEGEWFTAGGEFYPVDTIWLRGQGWNAGLSAVLRMADRTHVDGWIFPTPLPR
jgi:hypothetical protein